MVVAESTRKKLSIKAKQRYENGHKVNCKIYDIPTKEDLEYMYNEKLLSMNALSKMMDTSIPTLKKWLISYNIDVRGKEQNSIILRNQQDIKKDSKYYDTPDKDLVYDLYYNKGYTLNQISLLYDVGVYIIRRWFKDFGFKLRTRRQMAKNSYDNGDRKNLMDDPEYQKMLASNRTFSTISKAEQEICDYICGIVECEVKQTYRDLGVEFDIFIPSKSLAIEYNGLFFHCELKKERHSHKIKTDIATENNIHLIHIWEDDWNERQDIIKRKLKYLLCGPDTRTYARKCSVVQISGDKATLIYNENHIQGGVNATLHYGLECEGELISAMSFTKRKNDWELVRFASSGSVVGGFSKIVKHFMRNNDVQGELYSFADLAIVNPANNVYKNNGWEETAYLKPDYKYVVKGQRKHKFGFRHKLLATKLKKYDPNLTEYENCLNNNIYRIWDAGKIKYSYKNTEDKNENV